MHRPPPPGPVSRGARNYRRLMWLIIGCSLLPLAVIVAGLKGWVPRQSGLGAVPLLFACLAFAAWLGWRAHQKVLTDREDAGRQAMLLVIAAQLKSQDEATLQRIAGKTGPASEAANWILQGRREKRLTSG